MTRDFHRLSHCHRHSRRGFAASFPPIRFATCSSIKVTVEPSSRSAWTFIDPSGPYSSTGTIFKYARIVLTLFTDIAVCSTTAVVWASPHDPLSWSALGGVAYDVLDISYRAFLCVACDGPSGIGNTCEAFRGVPFFAHIQLQIRRSRASNFYPPFSIGMEALLVGYLIQKVDNITSSGSSLF
ncbi:hypothetical protein EVAR_83464_1 [Eumeta japonica]|uniref:Uncharacterized protein n=1 Tax=Eumeta variegata TaxID=151549 RepID=A0A4C1TYK7_EUMVA|nr:hypothetical protein EVAR_83464_1 [Eumeta japonica]